MVYTEAQTLEEAVDLLLEAESNRITSKRLLAARGRVTLRQQFAGAKLKAYNDRINGKISLASVYGGSGHSNVALSTKEAARRRKVAPPHPFRDLPDEQKPVKARAMFESGDWGLGEAAARRLAKLFGAPLATMCKWLDFCP